MADAKKLYDLQDIDLEARSQREELALVESRLGESQAVREARQALEAEGQQLHDIQVAQHAAEWEASDLEGKIAPLEKKLYGGGVKNPKELVGMEHELQIFKAHHREKEDRVLELMIQSETVQESIKARTAQLERTEAEWREEQKALSQRQAELGAALAALEGKRRALAETIEPSDLKLYEGLMKERGGRAVARAEQGMCQGCRISLSMNELRRVRGPNLVQCSSCGRILCLG
ncbi:MAG: zinc ribbon domain-containing protein [Dehalococcoidia bacterium]